MPVPRALASAFHRLDEAEETLSKLVDEADGHGAGKPDAAPLRRAADLLRGLRSEIESMLETQRDAEADSKELFRSELTRRREAQEQLAEKMKLLSTAIKAANVGLWSWDLRTNQAWYSWEWMGQLGYEANEIGTSPQEWRSRVHPDDMKLFGVVDGEMPDAPSSSHSWEYRMRHRDGSWRWILSLASMERDAGGLPNRLLGSNIDVTELHRAREAEERAQSERDRALDLLRLQVDGMPMACFLLTGDLTILDWNPAAERIFGFPRSEAVGRSAVGLIVSPAALESLGPLFAHLVEKGGTRFSLNENLTKDGRTILCEWHNTAVRDRSGQVAGILAMARDVTEETETRRRLERSERLYAELIENAQDLVLTSDLEGRVTSANPAALAATGFSLEEIVGRPADDHFHPESRAAARAAFEKKRNGARGGIYRARLTRKDGSSFPVEVSSWLFPREGPPTGIHGIIRDLTEREASETALRMSEERYRLVFENASDGIFFQDAAGCYVDANDAACRLVGYKREELIGKHFTEVLVVPPDQPIRWPELKTGRSVLSERTLRRKDGSLVPVEISGRLYPDGRLQGIVRDISARRRSEERLRSLNAELERRVTDRTAALEEANRELEAFAYSVSHDLRAPLRAIDGFGHVLAEEYGALLDEEGLRILARMRGSALRLGNLVDDLLRLSRVSRAAVRREQVDLSSLAAEVSLELAATAPGRAVTFEVEPFLEARADRSLVKILLGNLLANAWKFTSKHPEGRIEVGADRTGSQPVFFVRDDGAGFDPVHSSQLFQPFQRLHPSDAFEGTGIGLAIVERIVRKHGGSISADGAPERGATFRFTLGE